MVSAGYNRPQGHGILRHQGERRGKQIGRIVRIAGDVARMSKPGGACRRAEPICPHISCTAATPWRHIASLFPFRHFRVIDRRQLRWTTTAISQVMGPRAVVASIGQAGENLVPMSEVDLLLRSGNSPKEAWVNPVGGHLGREPRGWTDPVIFSKVILPWELRLVEQSYKPKNGS